MSSNLTSLTTDKIYKNRIQFLLFTKWADCWFILCPTDDATGSLLDRKWRLPGGVDVLGGVLLQLGQVLPDVVSLGVRLLTEHHRAVHSADQRAPISEKIQRFLENKGITESDGFSTVPFLNRIWQIRIKRMNFKQEFWKWRVHWWQRKWNFPHI